MDGTKINNKGNAKPNQRWQPLFLRRRRSFLGRGPAFFVDPRAAKT
jgi:hypothetical protein